MQSIRQWLEDLGLGEYAEALERNRVDLEVAKDLTDSDLRELGVEALGHRKRLIKAIAKLNGAQVAPVTQVTPSALRPIAPEAERRQLTVLFCDLVGSTELSRKLDPEPLRELMHGYQHTCSGVIDKYQGHIAQYLGDGLMVYFGWPRAHEDDAERAVRAALEIIEAVKEVLAPQPLKVRIGIATGAVVVGETGAGDASVPKFAVGETPNVAARLQALAGAGEIVIAPSTHRLVAGAFEYQDLGEQTLKGIVEPVRAWKVLGPAQVEGRFEAAHAEAGLTPMVGREEELQLLLRRWEQAKSGEGQVVLLCGEPGIGKSRITRALRERIADEPPLRLRYQCSPFHVNSALYPVIEHLERAANLTREDSLEQKLDKLEALLRQAGQDIATVAPLFAALLSLPTDRYPAFNYSPQKQKERTLEVLTGQVEGLSRQQPVLMLFEDAHWIDPTTQESLDLTISRINRLPVLLIITYRPEYAPRWIGEPQVTALTLNRLNKTLGAQLAEKVTGGKPLPAQVLEQIVSKTDGVPLFLEELTKAVLESGLLKEAADRYELTGPLPALAIPSTLQDSLMARLDRTAWVKEVAQLGAVIGREFSYELMAAVSPLPEAKLGEALEQLAQSQLVFRQGTPPDAIYTFKHALVQDVAYSSILRRRRQQLHANIVKTIEEKFPNFAESAPEILGLHYERADLPDDAVKWYVRAADRAQALSANREAINHLERALSLLNETSDGKGRDAKELDIRATAGMLYTTLEGWTSGSAESHFSRAQSLGDLPGHEQAWFIARAGLATMLCWEGRAAESRVIGEELINVAGKTRRRVHELIARDRCATAYMFSGRYREALQHWNRVNELYDPNVDRQLAFEYAFDPGVNALTCSAYMHWELGFPDKSREFADASIALARRIGHAFTLANSLTYVGADISYFYFRDPERALMYAREGEDVTQKGGFLYIGAVCTFHLGWALTRLGQPEEGLTMMHRALDEIRQLRAREIFTPRFTAQLAEAYGYLGRADEGLDVLSSSPDRAPGRERKRHSEILRIEGDLYLTKGKPDPEAAERLYREAIQSAMEDEAKTRQLRAANRLASLWISQGKIDDVRLLVQPIYDSFTEGFGTHDLIEAKQALAKTKPGDR